jgi:hypothetical protein
MHCRTQFICTVLAALAGLFSGGPPQAHAEKASIITAVELKNIFSRYQGLTELSVDFQQTKILKDVPNHLISKGRLLVKTPDRLVWTILTPAFVEVVISRGEVQITSGKGATADVQKITRAQLATNPQSRALDGLAHWLKFDTDYLEKEYDVTRRNDGRYSFRPRNLVDSPFLEITVSLAEKSSVRELDLNEKSGDRLEIHFEEPKIQRAGAK